MVTFERQVTKDYALSNGFVAPKGTTIGVPTQVISMDPNVYENPEVFHGFKFIKLGKHSGFDAGVIRGIWLSAMAGTPVLDFALSLLVSR